MTGAPASLAVALGERSYPVRIEAGLLGHAARHLEPYASRRRLVVVSDTNVWAAQGEALAAGLAEAALRCVPILVAPGEDSKSWPVLADLIDRLLELDLERGEPLVAFGGGVVGDLAGFAAAILKRGCPWIQIPTTLLAMVDSAVGGKTAINVPAGKNLVGAFHQPAAVLVDPDCLDTLPDRQVRAGYAEVVKYGLIGDPGFFGWCEAHAGALIAGDAAARRQAIARCIAAKAAIVAEDERDLLDRRALLNLGHTFAHALEAETGMSDRLLHGEAVAIGLALAFRLSTERGLCPSAAAERVTRHLASAGLPTWIADAGVDASGARLTEHMAKDKKARDGQVPLILARGIGEAFVDASVSLDEVAGFLDRELEAEAA